MVTKPTAIDRAINNVLAWAIDHPPKNYYAHKDNFFESKFTSILSEFFDCLVILSAIPFIFLMTPHKPNFLSENECEVALISDQSNSPPFSPSF